MKDCLVNFFSSHVVPDTFGYSSFVYAKQLGQGCEACTWGKVPNTHCQLYGQANACVLFGFAVVAVSPASEKKCDHVTVKTFERHSDARCKRKLIQSECRHIWIQSTSEQDHGHKTNASLQRGHCCPPSQHTQYQSRYSSRVIWSNYLTASGKQNVPEVWDFICFCTSYSMTLSLLNVIVKHRCQRYVSLIAASFSSTRCDPKWVSSSLWF